MIFILGKHRNIFTFKVKFYLELLTLLTQNKNKIKNSLGKSYIDVLDEIIKKEDMFDGVLKMFFYSSISLEEDGFLL